MEGQGAELRDRPSRTKDGLLHWAANNLLFLSVCCGYAACRICIEAFGAFPRFSYEAAEFGKVFGLTVALVVVYAVNADRGKRWLGYLPHLLIVAVFLGSLVFVEVESDLFHAACCFLLNCGTTAAMIQWLEYCGILPAKQMVVAIAAAYLINSAVSLPLTAAPNVVVVGVIGFASIVVSFLLRLACERDADISAAAKVPRRTFKGMQRTLFPFDVFVWIVITGIAFGLVEQGEGTMIGSMADSLGRAVPCIVVIVSYALFRDRFDLRFLYSSVLPLLVASLTFAGQNQLGPVLPGIIFSMGAAALRLITYALVCVRAYQMRVSAFFGCSCVMLCNVISHLFGRYLASVPLVKNNFSVASSILVVLAVTVIVFLIMSESEHIAIVDDLPGVQVESSEDKLAGLANEHGLTAREKTVLLQMAQGRTNAEIADALFISAGAVRSHTSRIYQKLGVGTRGEFDKLIGEID